MRILLMLLSLGVFISPKLTAQLFVKGATIFVGPSTNTNSKIVLLKSDKSPNADIIVETRTEPSGTTHAIIDNRGEIAAQGDFINRLNGARTAWPFVLGPNKGTLTLDGSDPQKITGTTPTIFNNLVLTNGTTKELVPEGDDKCAKFWMAIDPNSTLSFIGGSNLINLETNGGTVYVQNTSTQSIIPNLTPDCSPQFEGYVSSSCCGGRLVRSTDGASEYFFPVGAPTLPGFVRPIWVKPSSVGDYQARVVHQDPEASNVDGVVVNGNNCTRALRNPVSDTLCSIGGPDGGENNYYYVVYDSATFVPDGVNPRATADLKFGYTSNEANMWNALAQWRTFQRNGTQVAQWVDVRAKDSDKCTYDKLSHWSSQSSPVYSFALFKPLPGASSQILRHPGNSTITGRDGCAIWSVRDPNIMDTVILRSRNEVLPQGSFEYTWEFFDDISFESRSGRVDTILTNKALEIKTDQPHLNMQKLAADNTRLKSLMYKHCTNSKTLCAKLTVTNKTGKGVAACADAVSLHCYCCEPDKMFLAPSAFTPNRKDHNSKFAFFFWGYERADLEVYGRWGNLIFKKSYNECHGSKTLGANKDLWGEEGQNLMMSCVPETDWWNGGYDNDMSMPCQEDTYAYVIILHTKEGKKIPQSGTVTLLR